MEPFATRAAVTRAAAAAATVGGTAAERASQQTPLCHDRTEESGSTEDGAVKDAEAAGLSGSVGTEASLSAIRKPWPMAV